MSLSQSDKMGNMEFTNWKSFSININYYQPLKVEFSLSSLSFMKYMELLQYSPIISTLTVNKFISYLTLKRQIGYYSVLNLNAMKNMTSQSILNSNTISWNNSISHISLIFFLSWGILWNFLFFFIFYFLLVVTYTLGSYSKLVKVQWQYFVEMYMFIWIWMWEDKLENTEETLSLFMLWPWCIFLMFSHIFNFNLNFDNWGFAEWGLPVVYGFILLMEHTWEFGVYMTIFLMGMKTRSAIIVNVMEDLMAVTIMMGSVSLQVIRGLIVGMFHFMCSEALLNMNRWWSFDMMKNHETGSGQFTSAWYFDNLILWLDLVLAVSSLIVVTAIMFLQLTFLFVCVWLFCKCWYMSWYSKFKLTNLFNCFGFDELEEIY